MNSFLIFIGVLAGLVLLAMIVNKINGVKAHYIDALSFDAGETKVAEDREADFHVVTSLGSRTVVGK